ncbi:MAG: hypothetical protein K9N23_08425 [Akkermansiaceae bacterium]|nr:hypothetical protein [Akkermansiaceae bacterium]
MKIILRTFLLLVATALPVTAASPARMRPAFLPNTPPAEKAISVYTPADVLGIVATRSDRLPKDHPYRVNGFTAGLKANWPGAKTGTSIDAMLLIPVNAPEDTDRGEIGSVWRNLLYILQRVMDVTDTDKADAVIRVFDAQTDPKKKARAAYFAASAFQDLLDPRLLMCQTHSLDDVTEIRSVDTTDEQLVMETVRRATIRFIEWQLEEIGFEINPTWGQLDEAAHCAALKQWLTTNESLIVTKCAETRAKPGWKAQDAGISPFDARW